MLKKGAPFTTILRVIANGRVTIPKGYLEANEIQFGDHIVVTFEKIDEGEKEL